MGLRRLRGRLDQLQGTANQRMLQADELMQLAQDLVLDISDGFGIKVVVDAARIRPLLNELLMGDSTEPLELPLLIKIDPSIDN